MSIDKDGPGPEVADLKSAIRGVVRGDAAGDRERKRLIARAAELKYAGLIPDNWAADGSLKEKRETANDVFAALEGALDDAFEDADDYYYYVWVQDWDGDGSDENPYRVIFSRGGDLYAAPFSWADDKVVVDVDEAVKIRPITTYVPRGHRPVSTETRAARDDMRGIRETRRVPVSSFELREIPNGSGGVNLEFEGYASVTCADRDDTSHAYEMEDWVGPWQESIVRGAFVKTLRENCDVAFLVNHGGVTMARTKAGSLKLAEDLTGLHVLATLNPVRADVQILQAAVADGALDEMSFAFRVTRQDWNEDYDRRWITEVNLDKGDVSPVNYGANPHTGGLVSMRSAMALLNARGLTPAALKIAFGEVRSGGKLSPATVDLLAMLGLSDLDGPEPPEPEPASQDRSAQILFMPDPTIAARARLAQMRR